MRKWIIQHSLALDGLLYRQKRASTWKMCVSLRKMEIKGVLPFYLNNIRKDPYCWRRKGVDDFQSKWWCWKLYAKKSLSFPKYYIFSAKTAFERNLSKKSSLKFLIEMNNWIFNLATKRASWRKKMSFVCRDICYNQIQHVPLGIALCYVLIRLDQVCWSTGEVQSYCSYFYPQL